MNTVKTSGDESAISLTATAVTNCRNRNEPSTAKVSSMAKMTHSNELRGRTNTLSSATQAAGKFGCPQLGQMAAFFGAAVAPPPRASAAAPTAAPRPPPAATVVAPPASVKPPTAANDCKVANGPPAVMAAPWSQAAREPEMMPAEPKPIKPNTAGAATTATPVAAAPQRSPFIVWLRAGPPAGAA